MPAEDVKDHLTQHRTNKAFDRYFQHKTVPSTKALNAMADARKKTRKKGEVIDLKKAQNK
ncbi:MAG: hypothetical protein H0S80_06315 [Desulfovibrionaceae bacterium]|nr:hypothetical protein [Desulfovibrionaceae bacterium]